MELIDTDFKKSTSIKFETMLKSKFPFLQLVEKWKQTMWHKNGDLIVALIFSSKKIKFCFFNNQNIKLNKHQRWSNNIFSENLEIQNKNEIDWKIIEELIENTIQ